MSILEEGNREVDKLSRSPESAQSRAVNLGPTERLNQLFDSAPPWKALEVDCPSGVVAGIGTISGTASVAFATDSAVKGGALGSGETATINAAYSHALGMGCPIVGVWHSGGARIDEGVSALDAIGRMFHVMTEASGKIPQVSVVVGPAAGGAAYGPALTDVVIQSREGRIFVTGPAIIKSVTGEEVTSEHLGGVLAHSRDSGVTHVATETSDEAIAKARLAVALFTPTLASTSAIEERNLADVLPTNPRRAYDAHHLVERLVDEKATTLELHPEWAPNIITLLGRLGGQTIGVVANNPLRLGGCLDGKSADKAARFVRLCDSMGIPILVVVDVPGYLPGVHEEHGGVVRRGAKLLHAFAESVVPRVTLITRKAYGGAYIAMNASSLGANRVFAWPDAKIDVMGSLAAVRLLERRQLASASESTRVELESDLVLAYEKGHGSVEAAIRHGVVDQVLDPHCTRRALAMALLEQREVRRGRHGNIPL